MTDESRSKARGAKAEPTDVEVLESPSPKFLPYGRQNVTKNDIEAVTAVLRSDWLTQGPDIPAFEKSLCEAVGAGYAVACSSGTAALHLAMMALGIGPGDEVVTSPITFLSSANCARFVGAEVRFADIDSETGLMDPAELEKVLKMDTGRKIKAVIPVHLAGQPSELGEIHTLAEAHGALVVDDACHAIGARYYYNGREYLVGGSPHAAMTAFSFHPVKHVAMGEGGAVTTASPEYREKLERYRCHGMQKEGLVNEEMALSPEGETNPWYYEMQELGYNYRLTDIQAALGDSQLKRLGQSLKKRNELAEYYRQLIEEKFPEGTVRPLNIRLGVFHAYHLLVVLIDFEKCGVSRAEVMNRLRREGIGTQVHYIPVPLQPYYRRRYGFKPGDFPRAESYYTRALSLPMYPELERSDCERVMAELKKILEP